jgi:phage terminase Nu1 subunit (DNA packaging protein)
VGQAKRRPNRVQEAIARQEAQDRAEADRRDQEAERDYRHQLKIAEEWAKLTPEQQSACLKKAAREAEAMSYLASIFNVTRYGRYFR